MKNYFSPKGKFTGTIMPRFILRRKDLSGDAKILYAELGNLAGSNEYCFPSQAYLADLINVSIRTVQRLLDELVNLNLIEKKLGRFGSTIKYFFVESEEVELYQKHEIENTPKEQVQTVSTYDNKATSTYDKLTGGYDKMSYINNLNNKYINTPPSPPKNNENKIHEVEGNSYFEEFWELYPRKQGHKESLKVWNKFNLSPETIEHIFKAVKYQKVNNESWLRENGRYIPFPINWLKKQLWLDYKEKSLVQTQVKPDPKPDEINKHFEIGLEFLKKIRNNLNQQEVCYA